jgi:hypothetical protein
MRLRLAVLSSGLSSCCGLRVRSSGMAAGALPQQQNAGDDDDGEHGRGDRPPQCKSADACANLALRGRERIRELDVEGLDVPVKAGLQQDPCGRHCGASDYWSIRRRRDGTFRFASPLDYDFAPLKAHQSRGRPHERPHLPHRPHRRDHVRPFLPRLALNNGWIFP